MQDYCANKCLKGNTDGEVHFESVTVLASDGTPILLAL